jgi:hypothetical protein
MRFSCGQEASSFHFALEDGEKVSAYSESRELRTSAGTSTSAAVAAESIVTNVCINLFIFVSLFMPCNPLFLAVVLHFVSTAVCFSLPLA